MVGGKALKIADGYRLAFHFVIYAFRFALFFLRTNAAANGRQCARFFQNGGGLCEFAAFDVFNESGNIDVDWTAGDTGRIGTVKAACGLCHGGFGIDALVDFFVAGDAVGWVEFGHFHALNGGALFRRHSVAEFFTPFGVAGGYC